MAQGLCNTLKLVDLTALWTACVANHTHNTQPGAQPGLELDVHRTRKQCPVGEAACHSCMLHMYLESKVRMCTNCNLKMLSTSSAAAAFDGSSQAEQHNNETCHQLCNEAKRSSRLKISSSS